MTKKNMKDYENILLREWTGPYGGVPAFDKMRVEDIQDAIETGMKAELAEIDIISNNPEIPTFENTIVELERTGKPLDRAFEYYGVLESNLSTPQFREIQAILSPKIAEFSSKIIQNEKLFKRVKTVYESSSSCSALSTTQKRLVELVFQRFDMHGANIEDVEKKKRYREISKELSSLYTEFSNNVLHDEENYITYIEKSQLGGLSEEYVKSAAKIASDNGKEGMFAITNTRSSMDPFLTFSTERDLRQIVWKNYYSRSNNNDEYDNKDIVKKILKLRRERVHLLGYDNFAAWRLQNRMAKTAENVMKLMNEIWPSSIARVDEEVADMLDIAKEEDGISEIETWDYRYYSEKVRAARFDLNSSEVKQYLQLDSLVEAMHHVAGRLFNFKFTPVSSSSSTTEAGVPVFHEDVKVWEVTNNNRNVGLWYLDPYARVGKHSGAWATEYRIQSSFDGDENVLSSNNCNFVKATAGEPVLLSWDNAETLFHEFGHACHSLSAKVEYPSLNSGVVRDYVEVQSQLLEHWLMTDEVIDMLRNEKGERMPSELVVKIKRAATFNQGFATTEYLACAILDMKLHLEQNIEDLDKFEKETLESLKMPKQLCMRHRIPHFAHVFSSEGYATCYYGYIWADVLTADIAEAFEEAPGGFYDQGTAASLLKWIFAPRNAIDPAEAYRNFRGREPKIDALMRDRGFVSK